MRFLRLSFLNQYALHPRKLGIKTGTKRSGTNQDGSPRKNPGVKLGTKREMYNKDGSLRKKPGPKKDHTEKGLT